MILDEILAVTLSASKQANKRLSGRFFVSIHHPFYQFAWSLDWLRLD